MSMLFTCLLTLFNIVGPNMSNSIFTLFGRRSLALDDVRVLHVPFSSQFAKSYMCLSPLSLRISSRRGYLLHFLKSFFPAFRSHHLPIQTARAC